MPASPANATGPRKGARAPSPAGGAGRYVSKTTVLICVLLFVVGVVVGTISYLERSPVVEERVAGTNAVTAHVVLALVALGLIAGLPRHRLAQKAPYPIWAAPFSQSGLDRFKETMLIGSGLSAADISRAVVTGLLSIFLLYNFFRAGVQVIGGFDPNFTVNAWGGPSYLGALVAHYLDAAYLFYVEAFLLNLALVKRT